MSIGLVINNSLSALRINQQAISVLSQNIANVNTEGYSRQSIGQSSQVVEGIGSGVRFDEVIRKVDKYLQRAVYENGSQMNSAAVLDDYASRVQVFLGEPGSTNSMDEYVTNFFRSLQALAETPERTSFRSNVVESSKTLARELSELATNMHDLQFQAESDMKAAVTEMNALMRKLDNLNASITRAAALGQSTAGLLDERDIALNKLSEYADLNTFYDDDGRVNVYTANGVGLVDGNRHEIVFEPRTALESYINGDPAKQMVVNTIDNSGRVVGQPQVLITSGRPGEVTTKLMGGKLKGLQEVRDDVLPEILKQLDMFSSRLRDEVNRVHNQGVGFPAPSSYQGTRLVKGTSSSDWSGSVRIAVLGPTGDPIQAGYVDETYTGIRPLTIDLTRLNSGVGEGKPTVQSIIDEFNYHYGAPQPKAHVGGLNSITLTSNNYQLPNALPPTFNFDFDLENLTNGASQFFVTGVTVTDDTATNITNVSTNSRRFALDSANTYQTNAGILDVTVRLTGTDLPGAGDMIYLSDPGTLPPLIGGIASSNYVGYFKVKSVVGNDVTFEIATPPLATQTVNQAGVEAIPQYDVLQGGEKRRTTQKGTFTADLNASPGSAYYDISVNVGVIDADGNLITSAISYRVPNNTKNLQNDRFSPDSVSGGGTRVLPYSSQEIARAILVDENGVEIQKKDGVYIDQPGYLKLITNNADYMLAIDSLDSKQMGTSLVNPPEVGTGRGFSHYFELNNFFASNKLTPQGDTVEGSAISMALEKRIADNPNLLATGKLILSRQSSDPDIARQYTYVRYSGDNALVQSLADIANNPLSFDAAGGLPISSISLTDYLAEFLGYTASKASAAEANYSNTETLYNGFKTRLNSITGVNLDEELANTIIYQNAYTASAKLIKVADELYEDLLGLI